MLTEKKLEDITQTILMYNKRLASYFDNDKEEIKTYILDMQELEEEGNQSWMNL